MMMTLISHNQAASGFAKLKECADSVLVVTNDRLLEIALVNILFRIRYFVRP